MFLDIVLLLVGIAVVVWGADKFTDGASSMARRWNVSEMVIGLTVVAMGTSMPEFVVSFFSALDGSADMSVGNVVGSNIFNVLLIVGLSAMMMSMSLTKKLLTRDILFVIYSSLILVALSQDGTLSRWDALVLLMCFSMYMIYSYNVARSGEEQEDGAGIIYGWGKTLLYMLIGMPCRRWPVACVQRFVFGHIVRNERKGSGSYHPCRGYQFAGVGHQHCCRKKGQQGVGVGQCHRQ